MPHEKVFDHIYSHIYEARNQIHIFSETFVHWKRKGAVENTVRLYEKHGWSYRRLTTVGWYMDMECQDDIT